jgi:hypothetical protein
LTNYKENDSVIPGIANSGDFASALETTSLTPGDKKPSKLNYYTFGDELTRLGVKLSEFSQANGCCVQKMTILDEKLSTQDQI